jgi:hypothetical protein
MQLAAVFPKLQSTPHVWFEQYMYESCMNFIKGGSHYISCAGIVNLGKVHK